MLEFTKDFRHEVIIPMGTTPLKGFLYIPEHAFALVLFVHGSGSSRFSPRNQYVADVLNQANLATLLFDLFTPDEEDFDVQTRALRFDLNFLAMRLKAATQWSSALFPNFNMGYFGSSTGGGAALIAAAQNENIKAVVSRGGRPDLTGDFLPLVKAPTLLLVGERDESVIMMNQSAQTKMHCLTHLDIIPGATHLFEEPGTLEEVARLAKNWFIKHLVH
ncbi:dienelactone hydrolase family protein [Legionella septentrionalis]|uniref:dienelactone hydrolase family protein n=1 Tax=Legionella septentrionalis TaxID=2498109 RepID=UPI000F8C32BA|nr:dienelactone hydrolase family protein [Legionella septentrionalis]RUQ96447.1 alpha/beta hydrolase [Legionella septentrionalis]